jgi:hypothetical protein
MNCMLCNKAFPDEMGGNLCPRCDDYLTEAREEDFKRAQEREDEQNE